MVTTQWFVPSPSGWSIRTWGADGGVIFDDSVGAYHAITSSALRVVSAALALRLFTVAELVRHLTGGDPIEDDAELVALCLVELKRLGVVESHVQ